MIDLVKISTHFAQTSNFEEFPAVSGNCVDEVVSVVNLPTWYKYLDCVGGEPVINNINDVWGILVAIIEILLYIGGVAAVFYMAYGGVEFIMSQGQPDRVTRARNILIYSATGLVITILARVLVQLIFDGFISGDGFAS